MPDYYRVPSFTSDVSSSSVIVNSMLFIDSEGVVAGDGPTWDGTDLSATSVLCSGLTASLLVATDADKKLESVAKGATIADADGTLGDATDKINAILDLLQAKNLMT